SFTTTGRALRLCVTTQFPVEIEFVTDGKTVNYCQIAEREELYLDVQVSVQKTYKMEIDFVNAPEGIDINALIDYNFVDYDNELTLYVPTESEALMTSDTITVGRINMSEIAFKQYQTLSVERYNRNIFYDILPGMLDVYFTVNTDLLTENTVTVPVNTDGFDMTSYSFSDSIENVVIITDAETSDFSVDGIYAVPDEQAVKRLSDGEGTVPVQIMLPTDCNNAWVYGHYSVAVTKH
ncbi:MAG: hypothetical protein IKM24_09980, partial [Clostridia bacterium]|nr:hypothetical protein [Clostridia bacterium]